MIAGLVSYHDWVGIHIVEDILEHIRIGMELNDAKYNQKRLAVAKFLGELYNYRLIDSSVVFKVNSGEKSGKMKHCHHCILGLIFDLDIWN